MRKSNKFLLMLGMIAFIMPSFAEDPANIVVLDCEAKGFSPKILKNCPEYQEFIKQMQLKMGNDANDPKLKAENKEAFDKARDTAGVKNN